MLPIFGVGDDGLARRPAAARRPTWRSSTTCSTPTPRPCCRAIALPGLAGRLQPRRPSGAAGPAPGRGAAGPAAGAALGRRRCTTCRCSGRPWSPAWSGRPPPRLPAGARAGRGAGVSALPHPPRAALAPLRRPVLVAAFEGWNDAGDAATAAVEHLEEVLGRRAGLRARPRRVLRLPGQPPDRAARGRRDPARSPGRAPASRSAGSHGEDRDVVLRARAWSRTCAGAASARSCCSSPQQLGAELVVTLGALLADSPAHPAGPGERHVLRPRRRRGARPGAQPLRGPDRDRRRLPGRLHPGRHPGDLVLGRGPALRRPAAVPQGDRRAAAPGRGRARPARARSATCPSRPAPGSARSTSSPPRTATSPSTSPRWRSASRRPTCRRRPARRSPRSSSATCAGGATRLTARPPADSALRPAQRRHDVGQPLREGRPARPTGQPSVDRVEEVHLLHPSSLPQDVARRHEGRRGSRSLRVPGRRRRRRWTVGRACACGPRAVSAASVSCAAPVASSAAPACTTTPARSRG